MSQQPEREDARRLQRLERLLHCHQYVLGHELPNHFVALRGLACLLMEDEAERLSPDGRECAARLVAVVERSQALVSELAEIGRALRQQAVEGTSLVSLSEVAREAVAEANQLYSGRIIEYHIAASSEPLPVPYGSLRLVLGRLLRRAAAQHAPSGVLRAEIGGRQTAHGMEVWVCDNGPNSTAAAPQSFEPFAATGNAEPDQGLGLFLCSLLVHGWGGTLDAHREPGGGSRFLLTIPRRGEQGTTPEGQGS